MEALCSSLSIPKHLAINIYWSFGCETKEQKLQLIMIFETDKWRIISWPITHYDVTSNQKEKKIDTVQCFNPFVNRETPSVPTQDWSASSSSLCHSEDLMKYSNQSWSARTVLKTWPKSYQMQGLFPKGNSRGALTLLESEEQGFCFITKPGTQSFRTSAWEPRVTRHRSQETLAL